MRLIVGGIFGSMLILLCVVGVCKAALDVADRMIGGPPQKTVLVDYPSCVTVSPGPIRRPDGYGKPFHRQKDNA